MKNNFFELIYPSNISCIICDRPIKKTNSYSLCKSCFEKLNFIKIGCEKCGKFINNYSLEKEFHEGCTFCHNKKFYFDRAISCVEYCDTSKKIILGLKYSRKTYMCKYIATIMKEKTELEELKFDYILFVPLHRKRYKSRGFNQSEKIAKYLSKEINVPVLDCINRIKNTRMLYNLHKHDRQKELKNAFKVNDNAKLIEGKDVVLIDDVFTTGSTVNEISKELKLQGVGKIYVMTFLSKHTQKYIQIDSEKI
ncbi:MAG: ComF family protein [Clostridioides sp.]|jgi:competence protein ComFC|nr:ComF family protein [Clostridioides sp.]